MLLPPLKIALFAALSPTALVVRVLADCLELAVLLLRATFLLALVACISPPPSALTTILAVSDSLLL